MGTAIYSVHSGQKKKKRADFEKHVYSSPSISLSLQRNFSQEKCCLCVEAITSAVGVSQNSHSNVEPHHRCVSQVPDC